MTILLLRICTAVLLLGLPMHPHMDHLTDRECIPTTCPTLILLALHHLQKAFTPVCLPVDLPVGLQLDLRPIMNGAHLPEDPRPIFHSVPRGLLPCTPWTPIPVIVSPHRTIVFLHRTIVLPHRVPQMPMQTTPAHTTANHGNVMALTTTTRARDGRVHP